MISYSSLPNKLISAPNGVDFAYRDTGDGEGGVPLVLFQHFRGNLDNWDPALIDALAPSGAIRRGLRVGDPRPCKLQRLSAIDMPVFVANGDSDPMILPHYSYLLAGLIPQARVKIYPDAAHGFLFQHHAEFAADVEAFLSDPR